MKLNRKTAKTIALEAFFETLDRARLTLEGYNEGSIVTGKQIGRAHV